MSALFATVFSTEYQPDETTFISTLRTANTSTIGSPINATKQSAVCATFVAANSAAQRIALYAAVNAT